MSRRQRVGVTCDVKWVYLVWELRIAGDVPQGGNGIRPAPLNPTGAADIAP